MISKDCARDFAKEDQWKCVFPQYSIKYVKTPFVLAADLFDRYLINVNLARIETSWEFNKQEMDNVLKFAKFSRDYFEEYNMDEHDQSAIIYAQSCGLHTTVLENRFYLNKSLKEDLTLKDMLTQAIEFVRNDTHFTTKIIDNCEGIRCNHKCEQ